MRSAGRTGKACAAACVGLDGRLGPERRRSQAAAAPAAVDAGRARAAARRCACRAGTSGRTGAGDLLRRAGRRADEQGQAGPRSRARVHRGLPGRDRAAEQLATRLTSRSSVAAPTRTAVGPWHR